MILKIAVTLFKSCKCPLMHGFWVFEMLFFWNFKMFFSHSKWWKVSLLLYVFTKDIFVTVLEFEKLERLEFGGTKGAILNGQIHEMNEEFMELCKIFKHSTYDPSDYNNMVMSYFCVFILWNLILLKLEMTMGHDNCRYHSVWPL